MTDTTPHADGHANKNDHKDKKKTEPKQIGKALHKAEHDIEILDKRHDDDIEHRLERADASSKLLSSVWDEPPAELLRFHLGDRLTDVDGGSTPGFPGNKAQGERFIAISSGEIARYQQLLYANGTTGSPRRMLIVLQGMDASGKGGIVRHVFSQTDPMGIHYHGFGAPTKEEQTHDYLWRVRRELPKPGWISLFDRSHYEDIVMPHIYGTFPEDVWRARYDQVNAFEHELVDSGCTIIKIFLVITKDKQKEHFLTRLSDPTKHWKFDVSDLDARARWNEYMDAWQEVFEKTSTPEAPWYLVPADNRWYSRAVVSELLRTSLRDMGLSWPPLNCDADAMRRRLDEE